MNFRLTTKNKTISLIKRAELHFGQRHFGQRHFGRRDSLPSVTMAGDTLASFFAFFAGPKDEKKIQKGDPRAVNGQSVILAKESRPKCLWPKCHSDQSVIQPIKEWSPFNRPLNHKAIYISGPYGHSLKKIAFLTCSCRFLHPNFLFQLKKF